MRERLGLKLEIHASGWDAAELNNIASPAQDIRSIFDLMPTDTAEQWEHIAGRAHNVPGAIDGYIESLRAAKEQGKVSAARQVSIVIEQATKYAAEDGFFAKLAAGARTAEGPLPAELQARLDAGAAAARAAYCRAGRLPGRRTAARRPGQGRRRPGALRAGLPRVPGRRGGPRGDLRLGRAGTGPAHRRTGTRGRRDPARRHASRRPRRS